MPESVSPYALLCASKPKPAPTIVTTYDLYSAAQGTLPPSSYTSVPIAQNSVAAKTPETNGSAIYPSPLRTHYIADIHARHNHAVKGSRLNRSGF